MTYVINQLPNAAALSIVKSFKSHQKKLDYCHNVHFYFPRIWEFSFRVVEQFSGVSKSMPLLVH